MNHHAIWKCARKSDFLQLKLSKRDEMDRIAVKFPYYRVIFANLHELHAFERMNDDDQRRFLMKRIDNIIDGIREKYELKLAVQRSTFERLFRVPTAVGGPNAPPIVADDDVRFGIADADADADAE